MRRDREEIISGGVGEEFSGRRCDEQNARVPIVLAKKIVPIVLAKTCHRANFYRLRFVFVDHLTAHLGSFLV